MCIYIKSYNIHDDLNINNLIPNSLTYHTQYPQYKLHRLMWLEFEKTLELHNYNHVTLTVSGCLVLIIIYSLISYCKTKCKTIKSTHRCRFESYLSQLYYYYWYKVLILYIDKIYKKHIFLFFSHKWIFVFLIIG